MNEPGPGVLVLVATPIGNLGDLSDRARRVLEVADVVCCEDTRRTRALLSATGLPSQPSRLVSVHEHNEAARVPDVLSWLEEGKTVALVSDAGMPSISDPGHRVVAAAVAAGFSVTAVPGPSSVLLALVVSGLDTERFCVEGFLPRKGAARRHRLRALAGEERTSVVLEAPGRVGALLDDLLVVCGPDRPVAICRELTKLHEEVWRGRLADAVAHVAERELRGEIVVVLGGADPVAPPGDAAVASAVAARLGAGDSPRRAADAVAEALGIPRRRAYTEALTQRDRQSGCAGPPSEDRSGHR